MSDAGIRVVMTTAPPEHAADLVRTLVAEGLVACGNIVPGVRSIYVWQGEVCDESEAVIIFETTTARVDAAMQRLGALHPYACPKILALEPAAVHAAYAAWVHGATSAAGAGVDP